MVNINVSKFIHRPVADVFAFVTNFENLPKWETDFLEVNLINVSNGIGTTYLCQLHLLGRMVMSKFVITDYERNRKIAFAGEPTGRVTPQGIYFFETVEDGTKVTSQPRPDFHGFYRMLETMMVDSLINQNIDHLNNLKRLLER